MIRQLHEGTLKPRPKPKAEPKPRINRKKAIDELRDTFTAADPDALKRNTYWPRIISQLRDGLI